jgi:hypothetical protein
VEDINKAEKMVSNITNKTMRRKYSEKITRLRAESFSEQIDFNLPDTDDFFEKEVPKETYWQKVKVVLN